MSTKLYTLQAKRKVDTTLSAISSTLTFLTAEQQHSWKVGKISSIEILIKDISKIVSIWLLLLHIHTQILERNNFNQLSPFFQTIKSPTVETKIASILWISFWLFTSRARAKSQNEIRREKKNELRRKQARKT